MQTVAQWIDSVENDPEYFKEWLINQYRGEVRAAIKVDELAQQIDNEEIRRDITWIAQDEERHAKYIKAILVANGVPIPRITGDEPTRYWKEVTDGVELTTDELLAAGAHAEAMRLHRIEAVMNSTRLPTSVTKTFLMIWHDEKRHAELFRKWCSDDAFKRMESKHQEGLKALGLEI